MRCAAKLEQQQPSPASLLKTISPPNLLNDTCQIEHHLNDPPDMNLSRCGAVESYQRLLISQSPDFCGMALAEPLQQRLLGCIQKTNIYQNCLEIFVVEILASEIEPPCTMTTSGQRTEPNNNERWNSGHSSDFKLLRVCGCLFGSERIS